jgi:hypothetical protein
MDDTETQGHGDVEGGSEGERGRVGEGVRDSQNPELRTQDPTQDSALSTQDSALSTQDPALSTQDPVEQLRAELEEARAQGLRAYRRALLAENAGGVVPELVTGSTVEEIDESLEVARRAFEAARAAALAEMASAPVPAGNPVRQGPSIEGLSPLEKIAYGLKTSN